MSSIDELRVGLDEFARALMARPEKVVDVFVALCDDYDNTLVRISQTPLGTPAGIALATELQGRAGALQAFLNELYDSVTSTADEDKDEENGNGT